ncbi:MAG: sigma-70 family RNA polymerase sigma factor [Planctomycetota bacterium]|nr:sigma-70 family RNA polymerase sigma factor [Planctomycetota bacterium]
MARTVSKSELGWYLEQIKSTPLLTAKQERQLARRIREHSDPVAREQMIHANLRLVVKIAKEYGNPGMTLSDLVAEGNLGLMRAIEQFDPEAGVRFSTYAAWWIKQSIKRAMINAGQPIHIPAYLLKLITKWRRAARALENTLGRPATTEEMARKMKISHKKADIIRQGMLAVNAPSQMDTDETQAISEMVADTDAALPEQGMLQADNAPFVAALLQRLEPRERKILELRFALDGYTGPLRTFKEIGKIIGLTRERVRQLEKKALADLKQILEEE